MLYPLAESFLLLFQLIVGFKYVFVLSLNILTLFRNYNILGLFALLVSDRLVEFGFCSSQLFRDSLKLFAQFINSLLEGVSLSLEMPEFLWELLKLGDSHAILRALVSFVLERES